MNSIHPSILFALMASFIYGVAAPVVGITTRTGMSTGSYMITYGIGLISVGILYSIVSDNPITTGNSGIGLVVAMGILFASASTAMFLAFGQTGASISVVMTLVSLGPIVTAFIDIVFMGGATRIHPWMLMSSTFLAAATAGTAAMSLKPT